MDLDTVETGKSCPSRGGGKGGDDLFDLRDRHPLAPETVESFRVVGATPALREFDPSQVALAAGEGDLDDVLTVVLVDPASEFPPEGDAVVAIDVGVPRHDQAAGMDRRVGRDDRPDPAAGEAEIPV